MSYILYGDDGSGSAPVEMALALAGAMVERRSVPLLGDHQLRPEYLAVNPMGRIPALVLPDGMVVTESLAILLTVADLHPEAGLLPLSGSPARAAVLRWMALTAGEIYPCVTRSDYPERFSDDPAHAPSIRARAQAMAREFWRVVEAGIAPDPWVGGARLGVADCYLGFLSRWLDNSGWMAEHCPKLEALAQALAAHPVTGPVWARHRG
jgi:GST-like protein